jgi:hypothetical protein
LNIKNSAEDAFFEGKVSQHIEKLASQFFRLLMKFSNDQACLIAAA